MHGAGNHALLHGASVQEGEAPGLREGTDAVRSSSLTLQHPCSVTSNALFVQRFL